MNRKAPHLVAILLVVTLQILSASPAVALTGNAVPVRWYSQWEWDGNDWKVVFLIPRAARNNGFAVLASGSVENLVVSRSTFNRERYNAACDKVTMTTGARARLYARYAYDPWSDIKLRRFACSLRI